MIVDSLRKSSSHFNIEMGCIKSIILLGVVRSDSRGQDGYRPDGQSFQAYVDPSLGGQSFLGDYPEVGRAQAQNYYDGLQQKGYQPQPGGYKQQIGGFQQQQGGYQQQQDVFGQQQRGYLQQPSYQSQGGQEYVQQSQDYAYQQSVYPQLGLGVYPQDAVYPQVGGGGYPQVGGGGYPQVGGGGYPQVGGGGYPQVGGGVYPQVGGGVYPQVGGGGGVDAQFPMLAGGSFNYYDSPILGAIAPDLWTNCQGNKSFISQLDINLM